MRLNMVKNTSECWDIVWKLTIENLIVTYFIAGLLDCFQ
jgi:hypothetical protein